MHHHRLLHSASQLLKRHRVMPLAMVSNFQMLDHPYHGHQTCQVLADQLVRVDLFSSANCPLQILYWLHLRRLCSALLHLHFIFDHHPLSHHSHQVC